MRPPEIAEAAVLCRKLMARGLIIIAIDEDGRMAGASYGMTTPECRDAGRVLDDMIALGEQGAPVWSLGSTVAQSRVRR